MIKPKKLGFLEKALLFGVSVASVFGLAGRANAEEGDLITQNNFNGKNANVEVARSDDYFPGASDGSDSYDGTNISSIENNPDIASVRDPNTPAETELDYDVRPENSEIPYEIRLFYNGTTTESKTNSLNFSFPYAGFEFGDQEITFASERLPHGKVVDVRNVMNKTTNPGELNLIPLAAGTYTVDTPYGTGQLDIGSRLLSDLNDNGIVNLEDFVLLANGWLQTASGLVGDISGPEGIPDGTVDLYDLTRFCQDWLRTTPQYLSKANITPTNNLTGTKALNNKYLDNFQKDAAKSFYGDRQAA